LALQLSVGSWGWLAWRILRTRRRREEKIGE
jgi:hypothetical protein